MLVSDGWSSIAVLLGIGIQIALLLVVVVRLKRVVAGGLKAIYKSRKDASRHEWLQEQALDRVRRELDVLRAEVLRSQANAVPVKEPQLTWSGTDVAATRGRVLFVTSNGSGMGHITRCIAIAEAGKDLFSASIVTMSVASELARRSFPYVTHFQSPNEYDGRRELWHRSLGDQLMSIIRSDHPDVVAFDGTAIYSGVEDACRASRTPLIWIRRGLWKGGVDRTEYDSPKLYADHLVVPSEVGQTDADVAASGFADVVPPVVIAGRCELAEREEAIRALGLDRDARYCLVQVGSASVDGVEDLPKFVCEQVSSLGTTIRPVIFGSPVASLGYDSDVLAIKGVYPLARYLSAFDFAVVAGGYNSVHECIQMGIPAMCVPKVDTITDDQVRRVRNVSRLGLGVSAESAQEIRVGLTKLVDPSLRAAIAGRCLETEEFDGARRSADVLGQFLSTHLSERWGRSS